MDAEPTLWGYRRLFLIAGLAGILVGIIHRRDFTWPTAIMALTSGASCVWFVAPGVIEILTGFVSVKEGVGGLIYWACGMGGIFIVAFLSDIMRDPWSAAKRWWQAKRGSDA